MGVLEYFREFLFRIFLVRLQKATRTEENNAPDGTKPNFGKTAIESGDLGKQTHREMGF